MLLIVRQFLLQYKMCYRQFIYNYSHELSIKGTAVFYSTDNGKPSTP
jgi:hypothetical protein